MHIKGLVAALVSTITLLSTMLLVFPAPVHATSIALNPLSGTVGTSVSISGEGFAGHLATIYWDDQVILTKLPISQEGTLTCNLNIPHASKGEHILQITDDSNWASSTASSTFTVLPKIEVFPHVGRAWATVTVTGSGFAAFEKDIRVTWDGNILPVSTAADKSGSWSNSFDIGEATKGNHLIGAFSSTTDAAEIAPVTFIIGPVAEAEPVSGPVGTEITINGFGFRTGEDGITITYDGKIILCNMVAEADGSWSTTLNIPPSTEGNHTIVVYGSSFTPIGIVPSIDFNVVPQIEPQPASGNKGTKVTITGTGFSQGEAVTLSFDEMTLDKTAIADNTGSFNAIFEVPQSKAREHTITASGKEGNSARASFIIEKIAPSAPQLLSPEEGARLEIFSSFVDVLVGTAKYLIGSVNYLGYPRQQGLGTPAATFDWSEVDKPGNVKYTIQITLDDDFASPTIVKEGLVDSEYTLSNKDILTPGNYNWRVRAIDDVGNESPWSEVQQFEVITISSRVLIISLAIPVLLIAIIVAAGLLTWRAQRSKR
jgi:hypothetical protein